mmetsp:Transcript_8147/g.17702  ORF Transcript_8147/g.17702 Transcript_8147/m.17702 type:complete len:163 (-) Transcript_8147:176-664(-)
MERFLDSLQAKDLGMFMKRENTYDQNKSRLYAVALRQYTITMRAKLKAMNEYLQASTNSDVILLLCLIQQTIYEYKLQHYSTLAICTAVRQMHTLFQKFYAPCDTCGILCFCIHIQRQMKQISSQDFALCRNSTFIILCLEFRNYGDLSEAISCHICTSIFV